MALSIHNRNSRLFVSACVLIIVLCVVVPHLMDVDPPPIVSYLVRPAVLLGSLIGPLLPRHNIGTPEDPIYEGTPLDLVFGTILVAIGSVFYPIVTYWTLTFISKLIKHQNSRRRGKWHYDASKKYNLSLVRQRRGSGGAVLCGDVSRLLR